MQEINTYSLTAYAKKHSMSVKSVQAMIDNGTLQAEPSTETGRLKVIEHTNPKELELQAMKQDIKDIKEMLIGLCNHLGVRR